MYILIEQIELQGNLLNYFLGSNRSNIDQCKLLFDKGANVLKYSIDAQDVLRGSIFMGYLGYIAIRQA